MTSPAAFTSILGPNGKSLVFYVDKFGILKNWSQRNDVEMMNRDARNAYDDKETTKSDKQAIKTASKDLAALCHEGTVSGRPALQFRLYYSDENQVISELCMDVDRDTLQPIGKSVGGFWFDGDLNQFKFKTKKDTAISAHYNTKQNTLKVYYFDANARPGDRPTVTWNPTIDTPGWKTLDVDDGSM